MNKRKQRRHNIVATGRGLQPPYPDPQLVHIAIAGRSNVGKSSLINRLLGRKALAGVGKQPGKTRTLWFYRINDEFVLADLPGYGYAKVSKELRDKWQRAIHRYLSGDAGSRSPTAVIVLMDARHAPAALDHELVGYLEGLELPWLPVLTKADKVPRGQRAKRAAHLRRELAAPELDPIWTSATSGEGMDALWQAIDDLLAGT